MVDFSKIKAVIVPDHHGRDFWFDVVDEALRNDTEVIFLGDYLDPYGHENISCETAIMFFGDIINMKKNHRDLITLLVGNHDIHYINGSRRGCRMDYDNRVKIGSMFNSNEDLFEYAKCITVNGKNFIFSHAGFLPSWIALYCDDLGVNIPDEHFRDEIVEFQKNIDFDFIKKFNWTEFAKEYKWLRRYAAASYSRGGDEPHGSPLWADVSEHILDNNFINNCTQIFGHTQQGEDPIRYKDYIYCLDCRKVFFLTNDGEIVDNNMNPIPENGTKIRDDYFERVKKYHHLFV